jgi:hypothetical protein
MSKEKVHQMTERFRTTSNFSYDIISFLETKGQRKTDCVSNFR